MMNSILVSPGGEEITCKYFEINEVCKKIINNKIFENKKNEKQSQFAVFRNQEYYYAIYAEEQTITPMQKEFIDKLIVKKIINPYFVAIVSSSEERKQI